MYIYVCVYKLTSVLIYLLKLVNYGFSLIELLRLYASTMDLVEINIVYQWSKRRNVIPLINLSSYVILISFISNIAVTLLEHAQSALKDWLQCGQNWFKHIKYVS